MLVGSLAAVCGCGGSFGPGGDEGRRPTLSLSTLGADGETTVLEQGPNEIFEQAEFIDLSAGSIVVRGRISGADDVDIYHLGPAQPGDRFVVDMTTEEGLDGVIAFFDDTGAALLVNDHRNVYLGVKQPFLDVTLRRASSACYAAVSATPGYGAFGEYGLSASKESGTAIPDPRPDSVLLVFSGGDGVIIGNRPAVDVPPFDAADMDSSFAGQSDAIMARVVDTVRADYAGLDVSIYSTSEGDLFDGSMTRVYFGTFDAALLGVAEGVDEFNATRGQVAIVFADTFQAFMQIHPSVDEMGQALGNVASHEIGHLLGLVHTADPDALMDVTASLNDLLLDQHFRRSPIYSDVFPIGDEDSLQYLMEAVGGDPTLAEQKRSDDPRGRFAPPRKSSGPACRNQFFLSSCGLDE